jgi:hypothetical protein
MDPVCIWNAVLFPSSVLLFRIDVRPRTWLAFVHYTQDSLLRAQSVGPDAGLLSSRIEIRLQFRPWMANITELGDADGRWDFVLSYNC